MKIDKAIDVLVLHSSRQEGGNDDEVKEAEQLGIEALKQIDKQRNHHILPSTELLPGETKD